MAISDHDIINIALEWKNNGRKVAIATVIQTWGSAPRGVGSKLLIDDLGNFEGSVSGGCVVGAVIEEVTDLFKTGKGKILEYGVSNEMAWEVGLACGGTIMIYLAELN